MLKPVSRLSEEDQAKCRENGWIAYDPKNGVSLSNGKGKLKPGKSRIYIKHIPGLMTLVIWAPTDREAIRKANYIPK